MKFKKIAPRTVLTAGPASGSTLAGAVLKTAANGGVFVSAFAKKGARITVGPIVTEISWEMVRIVDEECKHTCEIGEKLTSQFHVHSDAATLAIGKMTGLVLKVKPKISMHFASDLSAPLDAEAFRGAEVEIREHRSVGAEFEEKGIKVPFEVSFGEGFDKEDDETKNYSAFPSFDKIAKLDFESNVSLELASSSDFPLAKGEGGVGNTPPVMDDIDESVFIKFGSETDFSPFAAPTDPNNGAAFRTLCNQVPTFFLFTEDTAAEKRFLKEMRVAEPK